MQPVSRPGAGPGSGAFSPSIVNEFGSQSCWNNDCSFRQHIGKIISVIFSLPGTECSSNHIPAGCTQSIWEYINVVNYEIQGGDGG